MVLRLRAAAAAACVAVLALCTAPLTVSASRLACGVCEAIVDEVNAGIAATTQNHHVQTRFRVDEKKRIPYARTEHNLLDIMESASFTKKFDKYATVNPHTKSARIIREAYERAAAGLTEPEAEAPAAATTEPVATQEPATTQEAAAEPATAAAEVADAAPASGSEGSAAAAPAVESVRPFVVSGALPESLLHNHVHLLTLESTKGTTLKVDHSEAGSKAIRSAVSHFLERHMDEAVLLFHKDVPHIKRQLCTEVTQVCKHKNRNANATKASKAAKKQQQQEQQQPPKEAVPEAVPETVQTESVKEDL